MSENKTQPTGASVEAFLDSVGNVRRREDARWVMNLMKEISGWEPEMWGASIIGFGRYRYKYATGREGDWPRVGLSPRKQNLVLYIMPGFRRYDDLMARLGKHKTGSSCLYINKLDDVDPDVLAELIRQSLEWMEAKYPEGL